MTDWFSPLVTKLTANWWPIDNQPSDGMSIGCLVEESVGAGWAVLNPTKHKFRQQKNLFKLVFYADQSKGFLDLKETYETLYPSSWDHEVQFPKKYFSSNSPEVYMRCIWSQATLSNIWSSQSDGNEIIEVMFTWSILYKL